MKMEYLVKAKGDGVVDKVLVEMDAAVSMKQKLVEMQWVDSIKKQLSIIHEIIKATR
jgi:hypothetical protein